ncbi:MAG TPA: hypothetical protein VG871_06960 [Vicinamibacterales bacterium]|nr:hypothetical protein [Vicinamibacterales bacterium]
MKKLAFALAVVALVAMPALAQEGHPLKGSWLGTWAGNKMLGNDVLVVMTWDGKNITGTINPGTDNLAIKNASLNPEGWQVHLEADAKDKSGQVVTFTMDGKIENLPLANRIISGTWKDSRGDTGALKIGRQ